MYKKIPKGFSTLSLGHLREFYFPRFLIVGCPQIEVVGIGFRWCYWINEKKYERLLIRRLF